MIFSLALLNVMQITKVNKKLNSVKVEDCLLYDMHNYTPTQPGF